MRKSNQRQKPKFGRKQKQLQPSKHVLARRGFKKFRLLSTGLDRLYRAQKRILRVVCRKTTKNSNNALARQSLRFVGPTGAILLHRAAALRRAPIRSRLVSAVLQKLSKSYTIVNHHRQQRSTYVVGQKYRLKLVSAAIGTSNLPRYFPAPQRVTQRMGAQQLPGSVRGRALACARTRSAVRALILRRSFALQSFRSKRRMRQRWPWRQYRKLVKKKVLSRFLRKHKVRIKRFRVKYNSDAFNRVTIVRKNASRLQSVRFRRGRNSGRGAIVRTIRRRWWGRALKRRRRRSRRMFAGLFGRKRWRRERRDKLALRRTLRHFNLTISARYTTNIVGAGLKKSELRRRRDLSSTAASHFTLGDSSAAHAPVAALRIGLRQLVKQQKAFSGVVAKDQFRINRRLDTRAAYRRAPTKALAYRVLSTAVMHQPPLLPILVGTGLSTVTPVPAQKILVRVRYRRWRTARAAYKSLLQRQIRVAALPAVAILPKTASQPQATAKYLLQRRGHSAVQRVVSTHTSRNAVLRNVPKLPPQNALARSPRTRLYGARSLLSHARSSKGAFKPRIQAFGFLNRALGALRTPKYTTARLSADAALTREDRRYRELQFYHNRPKMRLPQTRVTRKRRRKAGLVTFIRNSLQQPRSLLVQSRTLLPPARAYSHVTAKRAVGFAPTAASLAAYEKRDDLLPVFWRRPHSRANIKAINRVRRRRYTKSKRIFKILRKRAQLRVTRAMSTASKVVNFTTTTAKTAVQQKVNLNLLVRNTTLTGRPRPAVTSRRILHFLPRFRRKKAQQTHRAKAALGATRRTLRLYTPSLSRVNEVYHLAAAKRTVPHKVRGLWQARSVRAMMAAERAISAWSPQLSTRNRRQHYPRVNGVPLARRWLGFKAKRERRLSNAKRLERGIPQIRYTDYTPIKLQYFYGAAASAGYVRFRRVHRMHSDHSRWWRPNKQPVPFAHPYSRRDLNATRYQKLNFSKARAPRLGEFARVVRNTPGISLHSKFPPRTIPWRNFRYPRPRRGGAPKLLQRWTFVTLTGKTGRTAPTKSCVTVSRSAREIRSLHRFVSSRGVWKAKRWGALDQATLDTTGTTYMQEAVANVPTTTWCALRDRLGSPAAYTATRAKILAKLRRWVIKRQQITPIFSAATSAAAQLFFIGLLQNVLSPYKGAVSLSATEQHRALRSGAFIARTNRKAAQYLKLRELPVASGTATTSNLLSREQSRLYKRWLGGVEGAFKRSQLGYIPTSRSRYTDNVAIAFGRRRVRFPASGRRKKSYDSLLHAFSKKISPARFRRASSLRFIRVAPELSSDFKENLVAFTPLFGALRRRRTANYLSAGAYLSAPWRELLANRAARAVPVKRVSRSTKRRFLSLPTQTIFSEKQRQKRALLAPYKQSMYAVRVGILRRALRCRREERAFIDLRRFALQRRLPKEKATRPHPAHLIKNRRAAAKRGPYSLSSVRNRAAVPSVWTLVHLSAVGHRTENMQQAPLSPILPYGEVISVNDITLVRERKAIRGFTLPTRARKTQKLRRQNRDTSTRKRRARRANRASRRAVIRNTKHWSEKRDQRVRNTTFTHKKYWYARVVSAKLHKRTNARTGAPSLLARVLRDSFGTRRSAFGSPAVTFNAGSPKALLQTTPTAEIIARRSSLHRRSRVLRLEERSEFDTLRVRSLRFGGRVPRRLQFDAALAEFREQVAQAVPTRLVATATTFTAATSLWFQEPVTRVVKSAAAKEQDALADIAVKEDRYKLTAQYVESVTSFIPELMNYMLSKKIENKQVQYSTAQHMVRNIYWSLRVYLNVDPFDSRFFLRDKTPAARLRIFEDVSDLSETQKTLQPQRAALRYRFQPGRLLRAPSTKRFRGDWLRAFFPAKHALYQENPEDYGNFLLKTHRIRRLRIGPRGMDSWITTHQLVGHETRARQLLTLRCSRRRTRFETLLQTTRRTPAVEKAPWMAPLSSRAPFFGRSFSTYSNRGLALTSRWIHRNKRFVSLEEGWRTLSPVVQIAARGRVLARIEARGRASYINTRRKATTTTLLDARFTRAKSPRSRQYLIRAPQRVLRSNKQRKLTDLLEYKRLLHLRVHTPKNINLRWTRAARQRYSAAFVSSDAHIGLAATRNKYRFRRTQDAIFTRLNRLGVSDSTRSILHYHTARGRTKSLFHRKPLALLSNAIFANTSFNQLRTARKHFAAHRAEPSSRKPRLYLALKQRWTIFPRKLRLVGVNARANLFARSTLAKRHKRVAGYFTAYFGRQIVRRHDLARACGLYTRFRRQTPFETHRPRLWNQLTLRWMKKYRIGRYWLRDTSRWLRDPWLSEIVAADMTLRRDRFGGELRSQTQQVGEYVAEVDDFGRDIPRKVAPRERHKFQRLMPVVPIDKDPEVKKTDRILKRGALSSKIVARHRLEIARQARRKPVPSMRLANYEYRDVIREHRAEKAKSVKQKTEEEEARVKEYWARKAKKLPPIRPRRLPLKHPANLWLPHVIWKEIQRRIRKFEWRESDEVFFRRGFRTAFQFYPSERRRTPWLEHLLYTRATYSTRLREFRRRQYPHEQKKFKWLQRVRRMLYPARRARYIKYKRWPQLRMYNQKLHYSLFNLRDRAAARRRFKKLNGRTRPAISAFVSMSRGLTDRLDVTCLQMGFAPTIYWARIVAEFGLLRVNGATVYDPSYQLKPADIIYPNWDTVARFQHYFKPQLRAREQQRRNKESTAFYPTNMEYHRGTRAIIYKHAPDESDLRRSSRIRPAYFRWFKLDSV